MIQNQRESLNDKQDRNAENFRERYWSAITKGRLKGLLLRWDFDLLTKEDRKILKALKAILTTCILTVSVSAQERAMRCVVDQIHQSAKFNSLTSLKCTYFPRTLELNLKSS